MLSGESISSAATTAEVLVRDNDDGVITVTAVTGTLYRRARLRTSDWN